jgi:hypothetical protein
MVNNKDSVSIETLKIAIDALAWAKATRDLILTDEQKSMFSELLNKKRNEIVNQFCQNIGSTEEELALIFQKK